MIPYYNGLFMFYPFLPTNCNKPPTIYTILEAIVNPDVDLNNPAPEVKIKDLAKEGRATIFNFEYPLSEKVSRETFETTILNHFLQRRIGFETVTAFRIQLNVKLNEIMPLYNKMFDLLSDNDLFGEITSRKGYDMRNSNNTNETENSLENSSTTETEDISDRRNSELPQNQLEDLRDGNYVTNYNYDTNKNNGKDNSKSTGKSNSKNISSDNNEYNETITKVNLFEIYKNINTEIKNVYTMIFKDLECLFYQLV